MDFNKAKSRIYRGMQLRSECELKWCVGADIFGALYGYETDKVGDWRPDYKMTKFPGIDIKDYIYAEVKSVEEVNSNQYSDYVKEAHKYNLTILLIGRFPSFINNDTVLDMMQLHMMTAISLQTYKHSFLTMGINLEQNDIFGLVSSNPEVIKTVGGYKPIAKPHHHEAIKLITQDVNNICNFSDQKIARYHDKILHSYDAIKTFLINIEKGSSMFINTMSRDSEMNLHFTTKNLDDEVVLSTNDDEIVNTEFQHDKFWKNSRHKFPDEEFLDQDIDEEDLPF